MSDEPTPTSNDSATLPASWTNAELLQNNDALRSTVRAMQQEADLLKRRLDEARRGMEADRQSRRAALNLMEDAVLARGEALAMTEELQNRIAERREAEIALRESELQLRAAMKRFQTLNSEFDQRVAEQTQELRAREERLSRLTAQIKRVEWQERQRLARLLHDHVQQLLVAAHLQIDLVVADADELQLVELQETKNLLRDAIHATRDLSVQLTPPLLHDQGLPAALEWLISRTTREHGLQITTQIDDDANPSSEEDRDILFQSAQEFLLNAAKHSHTKSATLQLSRAGERIQLEVRDQGSGFDALRSANVSGSFGLFQLRQRLESVGGELVIESSPGQGTCATASVRMVPTLDTAAHSIGRA